MADLFLDCNTKDLERLQPLANRLMLAYQKMQAEVTKDLEARDHFIVTVASIAHLSSIVDRATKKTTTPRFLRSIKKAVTVARAFGTGGFRLEQK
jgi:citrate lyase alpha subunit